MDTRDITEVRSPQPLGACEDAAKQGGGACAMDTRGHEAFANEEIDSVGLAVEPKGEVIAEEYVPCACVEAKTSDRAIEPNGAVWA